VYSHIGEEERQVIQIEVGNGTPVRRIAAMLSRSASSISREIKRNTWFASNQNESYRPYRPRRLKTGAWTGRYYVAGPAQRRADRRRRLARRPRRMACARLAVWVEERLRRGFSPLLVSGRLRLEYPDAPAMRVCAESIYQWIYATKPNRERLAGYLPRAHRARRKQTGRRVRGSPIGMRVGLAHRAKNIESREEFGHWEADSVIGVGCHLHTEVERRTRYLKAMVIPDKSAANTIKAQWAMFAPLPHAARKSVTFDNGTEFAGHAALLESLGTLTYFADPYSSWQRGSNENRNGVIRRYLPKGTPISMDMNNEIRTIVDEINNRPMRILGYRTPAEAWTDELLKLTQSTTVLHL
jgi:IS30 family transposase